MKTKALYLAVAATLAFAIAFSAPADARGPGMDGCGMGGMSHENHAAMQKMHDEFTEATAGLRKQLFSKEAALTAELYAETPDDRKIEALTAEVNAIQGKIYGARVAMQKQMAREGIMPGGRHGKMGGAGGMMGGNRSCPMMGGGGGQQHGMQHGGSQEAPVGEGDHSGHTPAAQ